MSSAAPPELPDPAQSRAVLIGTSRYRDDGFNDLPQVEPGVRELQGLLCDERLWGLPRENCAVLLNAESPSEAKKAIESVVNAVGAGGTALIYFCGHGLVGMADDLHLGLSCTVHTALESTSLP